MDAPPDPSPVTGCTFWRLSGVWLAFFTVWHSFALPLVISYDGHMYLDQAEMLGTPRLYAEWDFLRQPLYPFLVRIGFLLFGKGSSAVLLVGCFLGALGTLCLGLTAKRLVGPKGGAAVIVLLSLYPLLVSYQHCALTESGTFFFLALITLLAVRATSGANSRFMSTILFIVSLTAGYYHRAPLLALAPILAILIAAPIVFQRGGRLRLRGIAFGVAICLIPYLLTLPWQLLSRGSGRMEEILFQRVIKQALLPPTDPLIVEQRAQYLHAIRDSSLDGKLTPSGVLDHHVYSLALYLQQNNRGQVHKVFLRAIREYPRRYLRALWRTGQLVLGVKANESDNRSLFLIAMVDPTLPSAVFPGPPSLHDRTLATFATTRTRGVIGDGLTALLPYFQYATSFGLLLTIFGFCWGAFRRNTALLGFTAIPLSYLGMHWVGLFSIDRYFFPAYPIVLSALVVIPLSLCRRGFDTLSSPRLV